HNGLRALSSLQFLRLCVCQCASGNVSLRPFHLGVSPCLLPCHLFGQVSLCLLHLNLKYHVLFLSWVFFYLAHKHSVFSSPSLSKVAGHVTWFFLGLFYSFLHFRVSCIE